ncbi:hypothetical protein C8R45DRAFT_373480 [Mycena sanguinolenta]|nr:hypothetical protein C8R45DRAFT_373480 [Mycena sanguinolenta]
MNESASWLLPTEAEPVPDDLKLLAICNFARKAQTTTTNPQHVPSTHHIQRPDVPDAAYARRPLSLTGPPIAIYAPVFTKFRQLAETADLTPEEFDVTYKFVEANTAYYKDEDLRTEAIDRFLRVLVDDTSLQKGRITYGSRRAEPDGYCTQTLNFRLVPKGIQEMKNRLGDGDSDALEQATCDIKMYYSSDDGVHFHQSGCCPAFLVAIEGAYICVAGAVFTDRIVVERLTDYVFIGSHPQVAGINAIDEGIRRIGKILKALKTCYQDIPGYYHAVQPPPSPLASSLPMACSPHLDQVNINDVVFHLSYQRRLAPDHSPRAVFEALLHSPTTATQRVVVKFTHQYCATAHELLARQSYAPQLLYHKQHDDVGGLFVIIMAWCSGFPAEKLSPEAEAHLRKAVRLLHDASFVFGDLRPPNVMVSDDKIMLVDFDWVGKEGEVRYPITINMSSETWPSGVGRGGLITREHDLAMLARLVAGSEQMVVDE